MAVNKTTRREFLNNSAGFLLSCYLSPLIANLGNRVPALSKQGGNLNRDPISQKDSRRNIEQKEPFATIAGIESLLDYNRMLHEIKYDGETSEIITTLKSILIDYYVSASKSKNSTGLEMKFMLTFHKTINFLATKKDFLQQFEKHNPKTVDEYESIFKKCFLQRGFAFSADANEINGNAIRAYSLHDILETAHIKLRQRDFGNLDLDARLLGHDRLKFYDFGEFNIYASSSARGINFYAPEILQTGTHRYELMQNAAENGDHNIITRVLMKELPESHGKGKTEFLKTHYTEFLNGLILNLSAFNLHLKKNAELNKDEEISREKIMRAREKGEFFAAMVQTIASSTPRYSLLECLFRAEDSSLLKREVYSRILESIGNQKLKKELNIEKLGKFQQLLMLHLADMEAESIYKLCNDLFYSYKDRFFDLSS